jgi:hypothetical protein
MLSDKYMTRTGLPRECFVSLDVDGNISSKRSSLSGGPERSNPEGSFFATVEMNLAGLGCSYTTVPHCAHLYI